MSGHGQGASHAAHFSLVRPVAAAVLFSGPQECPQRTSAWLAGSCLAPHPLFQGGLRRRTARSDRPSTCKYCAMYCAHQFGGGILRQPAAPAHAWGSSVRGSVGCSGLRDLAMWLVVHFTPLRSHGRTGHPVCTTSCRIAYAPPGVVRAPLCDALRKRTCIQV